MRIHTVEWIRIESWQKMRCVSQRSTYDDDNPRTEASLPEIESEARVSERSDLDTGKAADMRSDAPMNVAMEMMLVAAPTIAGTAGATMFEPID